MKIPILYSLTERLSTTGIDQAGLVYLGAASAVFLAIGVGAGYLFFRRSRRALRQVELENLRTADRLEIYRITVDKQGRSNLISN